MLQIEMRLPSIFHFYKIGNIVKLIEKLKFQATFMLKKCCRLEWDFLLDPIFTKSAISSN
jgi:hypothetical protein